MHLHRRALLISCAAVCGGLAAGTVAERRGWWTPSIPGSADPSGAIIRVARRNEAALIRAYEEALATPELATSANAARLRAYRDHHVNHLAALGGGPDDVADAPAPGQQDADPRRAIAIVPPLPIDAAAVPGYFADLQQRWASLLATGVRISPQGDLARLFALIAASESTHVAGWSRG